MSIIIFLLISFVLLTGCNNNNAQDTINTAINTTQSLISDDIPEQVAKLELLNLTTIDTYKKYKDFTDNINSLIEILNGKNDLFNIPKLKGTREEWGKISNKINEYGPLINNYNEVVSSAKKFNINKSNETLKEFYFKSGKFAFETTIIFVGFFYTTSYEAVGVVYRAVNLNRLALKCGPCVSFILSSEHWAIRGLLVEKSSELFEIIAKGVAKLYGY